MSHYFLAFNFFEIKKNKIKISHKCGESIKNETINFDLNFGIQDYRRLW